MVTSDSNRPNIRRLDDVNDPESSKLQKALKDAGFDDVNFVIISRSSRPLETFSTKDPKIFKSRNELQLARTYRGFALLRDRAGATADATKLRMRADEIFGRLRGEP